MRITWVLIVLVLSGCSSQLAAQAEPTADNEASVAAEQQTGAEGAADTSTSAKPPAGLLPNGPTERDFPHLHNLLQVTDRIYLGGEPQNEQGFAELAKLGVRTVVSVDGARPKVELAEKHGLRYVHIPIGYDGVPADAGKSFASLVRGADAPFYIHCHHGQHRGPAAAAIACIADGGADNQSALAILERAGTSKNYGGLWRDVEAYTPPDDEGLLELVSVAEVASLAAAMAQIDRAADHLKLCDAADWRTPAAHPDISPPQEALLLKEGFRETVRQLQNANDYDTQFLDWMKQAEETATQLESALRLIWQPLNRPLSRSKTNAIGVITITEISGYRESMNYELEPQTESADGHRAGCRPRSRGLAGRLATRIVSKGIGCFPRLYVGLRWRAVLSVE